MSEICEITLVTALVSAFSILFIGKTGVRDFIIAHSKLRFFSELFACDFCLSFWVSFFFYLVMYFCILSMPWWTVFVVPVLAAPITRILL